LKLGAIVLLKPIEQLEDDLTGLVVVRQVPGLTSETDEVGRACL